MSISLQALGAYYFSANTTQHSDGGDGIDAYDVDRLEIDPVNRLFKQINFNKARSPDSISSCLFKACADELTSA